MANDLNLRILKFQDTLRSKPVRENFSDIETEFNTLKAEVDNLSSSTSTSEIITSRDDFTNLYDRLRKLSSIGGEGTIFDYTTLDACNEITNWTHANAATALAKEGTNFTYGYGSIKLGKSSANNPATYDIDFANTTFDGCHIVFNIYIADSDTLSNLQGNPAITIKLAKEAGFTNYRRFDFFRIVPVKIGWNELICDFNNPTATVGTVADTDTIVEGRIDIYNTVTSQTITSGCILVDNVYKIGSTLRITEKATPDMQVQALAGSGIANGYGVYLSAAANSGTMTAPVTHPRYDVVRMNSSGLSIVTGTEAASPVPPDVGDNYVTLAWIYHRTGETSIKTYDDSTNGYVIDKRGLIEFGHQWIRDEKRRYKDKEFEDYMESDGISGTTSTAWQNKLANDFTPEITGDYLIAWNFLLSMDAHATQYIEGRVISSTPAPNTVIGGNYLLRDANGENDLPCSGFKRITLMAGTTYIFTIQMKQSVAIANTYIQQARIHISRTEVSTTY